MVCLVSVLKYRSWFALCPEFSLDPETQKKYRKKTEEWKSVEKDLNSDTLSTSDTKEVSNVHKIGKIDREIYKLHNG